MNVIVDHFGVRRLIAHDRDYDQNYDWS